MVHANINIQIVLPRELNLDLRVSWTTTSSPVTVIHLKLMLNIPTYHLRVRDSNIMNVSGKITSPSCSFVLWTTSPSLSLQFSDRQTAMAIGRDMSGTAAPAYFDDLLWSSCIIFIRELLHFPFCREWISPLKVLFSDYHQYWGIHGVQCGFQISDTQRWQCSNLMLRLHQYTTALWSNQFTD